MTIQPTKYEILLSREDIKEIEDITFQIHVLSGKFSSLRDGCVNRELIENITKIINLLENAKNQVNNIDSFVISP